MRALCRSLSAIVIISMALVYQGPLSAQEQPARHSTIREGSLIRLKGTPEVYVVESARKRYIPNPETFNALGYKWEQVMDVDRAPFESIPTGIPISSVKPSYQYWGDKGPQQTPTQPGATSMPSGKAQRYQGEKESPPIEPTFPRKGQVFTKGRLNPGSSQPTPGPSSQPEGVNQGSSTYTMEAPSGSQLSGKRWRVTEIIPKGPSVLEIPDIPGNAGSTAPFIKPTIGYGCVPVHLEGSQLPGAQPSDLKAEVRRWEKIINETQFEDMSQRAGVIVSIWNVITDKGTGAQLREKYKELYGSAKSHLDVARTSINKAETHLEHGELDKANGYLIEAKKNSQMALSECSMSTEVLQGLLDAGKIYAEGFQQAADTAMRGIGALTGLGEAVDNFLLVRDFAADSLMYGMDDASKKAIVKIGVSAVFSKFLEDRPVKGLRDIDLSTLVRRLKEDSSFRMRVENEMLKGMSKHLIKDKAERVTLLFIDKSPKFVESLATEQKQTSISPQPPRQVADKEEKPAELGVPKEPGPRPPSAAHPELLARVQEARAVLERISAQAGQMTDLTDADRAAVNAGLQRAGQALEGAEAAARRGDRSMLQTQLAQAQAALEAINQRLKEIAQRTASSSGQQQTQTTPSTQPGPNRLPSARFNMTSTEGRTVQENGILELKVNPGRTTPVGFSATRSTDPKGSPLSYQWFISGQPISRERDFSFNLGRGSHQVLLKVRDRDGLEGAVGAAVNVIEQTTTTAAEVRASINSHTPSNTTQVRAGQSVTLSITFTNTGTAPWKFIAGAAVWDSNGKLVGNYPKTLSSPLQPKGQTTVSWTHPVNTPGEFWVQFAVWKATPFTRENLLEKTPTPAQKLIVGVK